MEETKEERQARREERRTIRTQKKIKKEKKRALKEVIEGKEPDGDDKPQIIESNTNQSSDNQTIKTNSAQSWDGTVIQTPPSVTVVKEDVRAPQSNGSFLKRNTAVTPLPNITEREANGKNRDEKELTKCCITSAIFMMALVAIFTFLQLAIRSAMPIKVSSDGTLRGISDPFGINSVQDSSAAVHVDLYTTEGSNVWELVEHVPFNLLNEIETMRFAVKQQNDWIAYSEKVASVSTSHNRVRTVFNFLDGTSLVADTSFAAPLNLLFVQHDVAYTVLQHNTSSISPVKALNRGCSSCPIGSKAKHSDIEEIKECYCPNGLSIVRSNFTCDTSENRPSITYNEPMCIGSIFDMEGEASWHPDSTSLASIYGGSCSKNWTYTLTDENEDSVSTVIKNCAPFGVDDELLWPKNSAKIRAYLESVNVDITAVGWCIPESMSHYERVIGTRPEANNFTWGLCEPCSEMDTRAPVTSSPVTSTPTTGSPTTSTPTTVSPTALPSYGPSKNPVTSYPTIRGQTPFPTSTPSHSPTQHPTFSPTASPTVSPTDSPSQSPTKPSESPSSAPSKSPVTASPTVSPFTLSPTPFPSVSPSQAEEPLPECLNNVCYHDDIPYQGAMNYCSSIQSASLCSLGALSEKVSLFDLVTRSHLNTAEFKCISEVGTLFWYQSSECEYGGVWDRTNGKGMCAERVDSFKIVCCVESILDATAQTVAGEMTSKAYVAHGNIDTTNLN